MKVCFNDDLRSRQTMFCDLMKVYFKKNTHKMKVYFNDALMA